MGYAKLTPQKEDYQNSRSFSAFQVKQTFRARGAGNTHSPLSASVLLDAGMAGFHCFHKFFPRTTGSGTNDAAKRARFFAKLEFEFALPHSWPATAKTRTGNRTTEGRKAAVAADTPLLEVESSPLVPNVPTGPEAKVEHDRGGAFFSKPEGILPADCELDGPLYPCGK
jgi:hypothetical protein